MYMNIIPKFKRWFSNYLVRIRLGFWFYISREVTRTYSGIVGHWLRCNINDVRIQSTLRCAMRGSRIFLGGLTSDIYLCLLGVMVPAIFSVILLCKFQKFEFSRISPDTPLSFTRSTQCHQLLLCWQFLACVFYRAVEIQVSPNNKQIHLSWVSTYN